VQPGGHGVDLDLVIAGGYGHGTPGVGDGAGRDCVIHRFPVIRIFGSDPAGVRYQVRRQVAAFVADFSCSLHPQMAAPPSTTTITVSLEQIASGNPCNLGFANNAAVLSGQSHVHLSHVNTESRYSTELLHYNSTCEKLLIFCSFASFCGFRGHCYIQPAGCLWLHSRRPRPTIFSGIFDNSHIGPFRRVHGT
jgi:hypothetical protein